MSLAQRQWRQRAQTAVRVAMTATKEARSRFKAVSDAGDAALSAASNSLLSLAMLPGLRLGVLSGGGGGGGAGGGGAAGGGVGGEGAASGGPLGAGGAARAPRLRPDVRAAAARKLARRQAAMAAELQERVAGLAECVAALRGALAGLEAVPQDEEWMLHSPVFHTMPLATVRRLLARVHDMYCLEHGAKAAVAVAMCRLLLAAPEAAGGAAREAGVAAGSGEGGCWAVEEAEGGAALAAAAARAEGRRLSELCAVYVSTWMLGPYLEEGVAEEAVGAVEEDMVGF